MLTITHAETVAYYPEQFAEPCRIVRADWPYDCEAKRKHHDHEVYICEPHAVWWHRAPGEAHDFTYRRDAERPELIRPACSCGDWMEYDYVGASRAITAHRAHAGTISAGWCPAWDGKSTGQDDAHDREPATA